MTSINRTLSLSCTCIAALAMSSIASAQTRSAGDGASLEDIVVTAQKRAENLQDVPIAITAVTGTALAQSGIRDTQDLVNVVPGLTIRRTNAAFQPFIRGVGTTAGFVENPVALYVDGVYIADQRSALVDFSDVEQVAVLKGPQGTLFGRNSTAGVIQITTRDPSYDLHLNGSISYDNIEMMRANGYVSGGLTKNIAASVSVNYAKQFDGLGRNQFTGKDVLKQDHDFSIRGKLMLEPGDDTKIVLIGEHVHQLLLGSNQRPYPGTISPYPGFPANLGRYDSVADLDRDIGLWHDGGSARIEQGIGDLQLTSITAYRRTNNVVNFDADGVSRTIAHVAIQDSPNKVFTQELQLNSSSSGPFKWQIGAYYFWNKASAYAITTLNPPAPGAPPPGARLIRDAEQTAKSISGFGEASWEFLPGTKLTGGIRYTDEKRDFDGTQTIAVNNGGSLPSRQVAKQSIDKVTFRAALDHELSKDLLVYASFNTGFKSGGYNILAPVTPAFLPETLNAYEVGIKAELFDHSVRFNAAGFYYDYNNIQVFRILDGVSTVSNAAKARIYGMDADIVAQLAHGLKVSGGLSLLSAKYREYTNAQAVKVSPTGAVSFEVRDVSGNYLPNSQKISGNAAIDYDTEIGATNVHFNVTGSYQGRYFLEADNFQRQKGYVMLNSSVKVDLPGGWGSVTVWGKNLLDKYIQTFGSSGALNGATAEYNSPPRTYGLTLAVKY